MSATAGKASRTTISPSPRLRMYGEEDPASEPMPETWINCLMRASRASRANSCGSCYMDGVEGLLAALHIETHGVHDALNSRHGSGNGAIIIDVGTDRTRCQARRRGKGLRCVPDASTQLVSKIRTRANAGRRGGRESQSRRIRSPSLVPSLRSLADAVVPFRRKPPKWAASRCTAGYSLCQRQVRLIVTRRVFDLNGR